MRIARVEVDDSVHLARIEKDGQAVLLHTESRHPAADVLREAVAAGVPLDGVGAGLARDYRLLVPVTVPSKFFGVGLNTTIMPERVASRHETGRSFFSRLRTP